MIIGLVCDLIINPKMEEWVLDKMDEIIKRGKAKDAIFITMSLEGMTSVIVKKFIEHKVQFFVVSPFGGYSYPSAICTFKADITFMAELSNYVVIMSNGQVHSEWDKVRELEVSRLEVNNLLKKEKFIK